jgi:ABC-type transport system substrate-binding protein
VQGVGTRPHPDITFWRDHYSGASFNATGFVDPELDALILRARSAIKKEEQLRLYAETQACVHRGLPELPIVCPDTVIGWRPGAHGLLPHPIGTLNLQDVKID